MTGRLLRLLTIGLWIAGFVTLLRVGVLYAAMFTMDKGGVPPRAWSAANVRLALWYVLPTLGIILAHEWGHWRQCRRYGVEVAGPFLIPWPSSWATTMPWVWLPTIGVLAAFLRLRTGAPSKLAAWDIAFQGLWWGFLATLVCTGLGALWSVKLTDPHIYGHVWTPRVVRVLAGARVTWHPVMMAARVGWCLTVVSLLPCWPADGYRLWWAIPAVWRARRGQVLALGLMCILCLA